MSEFYVPTFRNTLYLLHRWCKQASYTTYKGGTQCSETSTHKIQNPRNHPKERILNTRMGRKFEIKKNEIFFLIFSSNGVRDFTK